ACSAGGRGHSDGGGAAGWFLVLGVLARRRRRPIDRLAPRT
ncbi:MAG: GlyGly-CTERM sorting domain-containing protein, partial [Deltaproteobacteria bacterium]|nr:GlyGly-CTERM sorting domain-containing protein [Deltaproteobacteria bacterium]